MCDKLEPMLGLEAYRPADGMFALVDISAFSGDQLHPNKFLPGSTTVARSSAKIRSFCQSGFPNPQISKDLSESVLTITREM